MARDRHSDPVSRLPFLFILGGRGFLERVWPGVIFLVFMLPLPPLMSGLVALPLQRIATVGSDLHDAGIGLASTGRGECHSSP